MTNLIHQVKVNEFIEITLNIPEKLSILELRSILMVVDKITKTTNIDEPIAPRRKYTSRKVNQSKFNDEVNNTLISLKKEGKTATQIVEILNKKYPNTKYINRDIWNQVYILRTKKGAKV